MPKRLIIVANRLPFSIRQSKKGLECAASPGGMASALTPIRAEYNAAWIGWAGLERPLTPIETKQLSLPSYAQVVDIPATMYNDYYYAVANGVLWPAFHGFTPRALYSEQAWQTYVAVNQLFANRSLAQAGGNDQIWIHDFHLFLVPGMLRAGGFTGRIGFFLHVTVAKPKLLASLPHWQDILDSLATVDLCGVQTMRDAHNLKQCYQDANTPAPRIAHFPIGIDTKTFTPRGPAVKSDRKTVLSISRLDYTKGVPGQLRAMQRYLQQHPKASIRYKLVVAPSREGLAEYRNLKQEIDQLVNEIKRAHPGVIDYDYRNLNLQEMMAEYQCADVLVTTPIVDGMNLVAKEYVIAHPNPGVLIISTTIGAAEQLTHALQVAPDNVEQLADALHQALTMADTEKHERWQAMKHNVQTEDVHNWTSSFLQALQ